MRLTWLKWRLFGCLKEFTLQIFSSWFIIRNQYSHKLNIIRVSFTVAYQLINYSCRVVEETYCKICSDIFSQLLYPSTPLIYCIKIHESRYKGYGGTHSFFNEEKYLLTKYLIEISVQLKWTDSESLEQWNYGWLYVTFFKIYSKTSLLEDLLSSNNAIHRFVNVDNINSSLCSHDTSSWLFSESQPVMRNFEHFQAKIIHWSFSSGKN